MGNELKRVNTIYKDCGIGRIAAIVQIKDVVSFTKNPIRTICLYHYYLYLSKYLNYDKVYIVSNIPTLDKEYWKCENILKDLPIIYGTSERYILNKYKIDDLYMHQSTPNFYGGTIFPHYPFNINRITEWWLEYHNKGGRLYYIQDDPLFPNSNLAKICNKRLFDIKNVYCTYSKAAPKELVDPEVKLTESLRDDIDAAMKDTILAFCGIDYTKFWYSIKEDARPEVNKWDVFSCYLWQGVNDNLDIKLVDYPWEGKKYDAEYHGVTKSGKRTKVTEAYYSALRNKFLHITGRSPFFTKLEEGKDFDKHDVMEYYDLLQFVAQNSKSAFITHEDSILGNQISPRYFDCMLSDIIAFCDTRYDPDRKFTDNDELKEFMYVSTPEEFSKKVDMIANNEAYYRHIKYLQRKSIFDNFREFINEENIPKYKDWLDKNQKYEKFDSSIIEVSIPEKKEEVVIDDKVIDNVKPSKVVEKKKEVTKEPENTTTTNKYDSKYIRMAKIWAENSYAIRNKVGALLVKDGMIISDGYNGTPKGFDNICENEVKCDIEDVEFDSLDGGASVCKTYDSDCNKCPHHYLVTKPEVLHAEANAITKVAKSTNSSDGSTLYVTLSPCLECSKLIIQAGIKRVVYADEYRDTSGLDLLRKAGIKVEQIKN